MLDAPQYLSEQENIRQIDEMVEGEHKDLFQSFLCKRVDPGFAGKIYIVYKPNKQGAPSIIGQIKILDWYADIASGPTLTIEDMSTGRRLKIGVVPTKLWEYDVFMACAPYTKLRWDLRITAESCYRSLLFTLLIRTKTRADQYTDDVTYCEGLKPFKLLYPHLPFALSYY